METKVQKTEKPAEKNITDFVGNRIQMLLQSGELTLPSGYSPENAVKSAYLILTETEDRDGNKALDVCTRPSIINALMDMIIMGLSPAKKQCAFIMRWKKDANGNRVCKLYCDKQYQGTIALAKRHAGLVTHPAQVVYEKDEFEYEIRDGKKTVTKHIQKLENISNNEITAAYCILTFNTGYVHTEIMDIAQIRTAWDQGPMKGNSGAHKKFTDQMCMKTVISRGCKLFIQSSDDSEMYAEGEESPYKAKAKAIPEDAEVIGFEEEKKQIPAPQQGIKKQAKEPEMAEKVEAEDPFQYETKQPDF